jgi:hypothetical protein
MGKHNRRYRLELHLYSRAENRPIRLVMVSTFARQDLYLARLRELQAQLTECDGGLAIIARTPDAPRPTLLLYV